MTNFGIFLISRCWGFCALVLLAPSACRHVDPGLQHRLAVLVPPWWVAANWQVASQRGGGLGCTFFDLITQHPSFCETSPTTFYCSNQSATSHNAHLSSTTNLYYTDTEYKVQQRSISKRLNLRLQTSVTATGLKTTQSDNTTHSCNSFSGKVHILNFSSSPPTHPPSLLPA